MALKWKLREKLILNFLVIGVLPLVIAIAYVGHEAQVLIEKDAKNYLQSRVEAFAGTVQTRYSAISGNIDEIRIPLVDKLKMDILPEAAKEKYFATGYLILFQSNGFCRYHPKPEFMSNTKLYDTYDFIRAAVNQKQGFNAYTFQGVKKLGYLAYNKDIDIIMWAAVPDTEVFADVKKLNMSMYIFLAVVAALIVVISGIIAKNLADKVKDVTLKMQDIAEGEGDLTVRLPVKSKDEIGDLAHWFNVFMENLEQVIIKVKQAAIQVDTATQEVSSGAEGLSQASQEQASAVEEVAATIEEMTSSIKQNASNADAGRDKAKTMVAMANASSTIAKELIKAMDEMSAASKKIGDITVTVNEVAFQTNLLALNAAVEAARAGEHGKGFAVVAEEVRALAQRSADAARQIKVLIEDTVGKIGAGDNMVKKSGQSLEDIIRHIEALSQTIEEIAASSAEQSSGIDELNRAVSQIDASTQQNASTVEELASTASNLTTDSQELASTVERFKVAEAVEGPARKGAKTMLRKKPVKKPLRTEMQKSEPSPDSIGKEFEEF